MNKFYLYIAVVLLPFVFSCSKPTKEMNPGIWRGNILLDKEDAKSSMPFLFALEKIKDGKIQITLMNAEERIIVNEIYYQNDSVFIKLPVFRDEIKALVKSGDTISGEYYHVGSRSKYYMPFYAVAGAKERFENIKPSSAANISGRWELTGDPGDSTEYKMIGEFVQKGSNVTGSVLTTSGDHRYLDGVISGNELMLSTIDGTHTLLFRADIRDNKLENGLLIGGPKWRDKWTGLKNDNAKLPDAESITKLKGDVKKIDFSFSDLNGKRVSLSDERYKDKPVIVQIMGSWCPNCMDETRLFTELYDKYSPKGLKIVGLCFESNNFEESRIRIERFVSQLNAKYDFLYAGEVGKSIKETLPFIEKLNGYPTTLYLDKEHNVVKIYTGFSGPGTGKHYFELKDEIVATIEKLL